MALLFLKARCRRCGANIYHDTVDGEIRCLHCDRQVDAEGNQLEFSYFDEPLRSAGSHSTYSSVEAYIASKLNLRY